MPLVSANAPTDAYKVQGVSLQLPRAYFDGAVLTADEASWMNRQLGNVVTNSYSSGIRRQLSEIDESRAASWKAKKYTGPMDEAGKKPAAATILDLCDSEAEVRARRQRSTSLPATSLLRGSRITFAPMANPSRSSRRPRMWNMVRSSAASWLVTWPSATITSITKPKPK